MTINTGEIMPRCIVINTEFRTHKLLYEFQVWGFCNNNRTIESKSRYLILPQTCAFVTFEEQNIS